MKKKIVKKEPPEIINSLPQDLRKISKEQFEAWVRWLAETKPLEGKDSIREYQAIAQAQITSAHEQLASNKNNERLERGLANSLIGHSIASAAVDLQTFGGDGWQAHIPHKLLAWAA